MQYQVQSRGCYRGDPYVAVNTMFLTDGGESNSETQTEEDKEAGGNEADINRSRSLSITLGPVPGKRVCVNDGISLEICVEKVTGLNLCLLHPFHLTSRYFYLSFGDRAICRATHVGSVYSGRARAEALHRKTKNWCYRCAIKDAF